MKIKNRNIAIGVLIILTGLLLLLHNIRVFYLDEQLFWGLGLIILGVVFLRVNQLHSPRKSILIPGILLLIIGLFILLDALFYLPGGLIGTCFLWIVAAIFLTIYIHNNKRWAAIMPGGLFFILGIVVLLGAFHILAGDILWFIFLAGISLIFWYLFLIKDDVNKLHWALFPALLLTIFSFFILSQVWATQLTSFLFPVSIIFCGVFLLINSFWKQVIPKSTDLTTSEEE